MASLWQNFIGPIGQQGNFGGQFVLGLRFKTDAATDIINLSWYATNNNTADKPTRLDLWDHATGTVVASTSAIAHSGAPGWQPCPLTGVYTTSPGQVFEVSGLFPTTTHMGGNATAPPAVTGLPLVSPGEVQGAFNIYQEPTSTGAFYWAVDVNTVASTSTGGSGGTTATPGDVEASLADWLISTSDNQHQTDGLPWLTKTAVDAVKVVTDKLGASGSGSSLDWIAGLWRLAGDLTDGEIGLLKLLLDRKDQLTGASGGGGSAFFGPEGTQVSAGVETLLGRSFTLSDLGAAIALLRERLDLSPYLADTTRWTLVDTINGVEDALVNVQADAYFFNLTSIPPGHPQMGIAATLWVPRWGWVAPRVHAHFRQRQFTDIFPALFTSEGLFMDGILVHALPGFEWMCECYTLDRS